MTTEREVQTAEGEGLAKTLGCDFTEASAKTCVNVEKGELSVLLFIPKKTTASNPPFSQPTAFYSVVRQIRKKRTNGTGGGGAAGKSSPEKKKKGGCLIL